MPFFIVDDGFSSHPKVTSLKRGATRERAAGLWVLAGSWSSRYLTEGRIPYEQVDELGCSHVAARWLVERGLWERTDDGYAFHDWTGNGNPTRDQVLDRRAKRAEAGAKGGKASGQSRRGRSKPEANAEASATQVVEPQVLVQDQVPSSKFQTPVVTLVCRRLSGDARSTTTDIELELWTEAAGNADLETELKAWLIHNAGTDLRDPGAALLGWLRTAAKRAGRRTPDCSACIGGWMPDEFGQPSERRCPTCRPQLRAVEAS